MCMWRCVRFTFFPPCLFNIIIVCRSPGGSGCVRGAGPRVHSPAVRLHAGPRRHLHYLALLVPHPVPLRHAVRERGGGGGLFLLWRDQSHLSVGALRAARQHPPAAGLQGWRGGHDRTGEVRKDETLLLVVTLVFSYQPSVLVVLSVSHGWLIILTPCFLSFVYCRYLDSVTNKDSTLPPIPHLHSLLTDNGEPHPDVDIFKLVRSSYEVKNPECSLNIRN